MTVKTQNAKVILKGGKVSCSCCEEPVDCCMYPAQALEDGLYSASDLPDGVTISGVSYLRSGSGYGNTTNGVILEENVWARYKNGSRSSRACLIQGGVEDQFADTYTFASAGMTPPSVVVTRRSLCRWDFFEEDPEGGGRYWILEYANDRGPDALWYFTIPSTFPGYKTGLQNSPVGTYTGSGLWTGTIS